MRTGAIISATAHGSLLWLLVFGGFDTFDDSQPDIVDAAQVELISDQELRSLFPETIDEEKSQEVTIDAVETEVPTLPSEPIVDEAEIVEINVVQEQPQPSEPEIEKIIDSEPLERPIDEREVVSIAETETDVDIEARQVAPRIAEDAALEPRNEAETETVNSPQPPPLVPEFQEEKQEVIEPETVEEVLQEKTATETVTEADETEATALVLTRRPLRRPPKPEPISVEAEREPEPLDTSPPEDITPESGEPEDEESVDIAALIAGVQEEADESDNQVPVSSLTAPLTASEKDGLKGAIQACWNLGSLSDAAKRIVVTISVSLQANGRPVPNSIKLLNASPGSEAATRKAFEAGRRAILRCLTQGYELPPDKYESWRRVEIVFNPEEMRKR